MDFRRAVREAVYARLTGFGALTVLLATPASIYFGTGLEDEPFAYIAISTDRSAVTARDTAGNYLDHLPFQFSVFDTSQPLVADIMEQIEAAFGTALVLAAGTSMYTNVTGVNIEEDPDKHEGEVVYHGIVLMDFFAQN